MSPRYYFSFRGTAGRRQFWIAHAAAVPVGALAAAALMGTARSFSLSGAPELLGVAALAAACWVSLAAQAKRWRDLRCSPGLVLINLIPGLGPLASVVCLGFFPGSSGKTDPRGGLARLFSARGRIGRRTFWLTWLGALAVFIPLLALGAALNQLPDALAVTGAVLVVAAGTGVFWVVIVAQVKRWHDRDRSGWMVLLGLIPIAGFVIVIVSLGFIRGTPGPNRYGPAPAGAQLEAPASPRSAGNQSRMGPAATAAAAAAVFLGAVAVGYAARTAGRSAGEWDLARAWLGSRQACEAVALQYREGRGRIQDLAKAAAWYEKAATKGSDAARYDLGILRFYGLGVPRDAASAAELFRAAADRGFSPAMVMLGVALEEEAPGGAEARALWEKAARLQNPWAESLLGSAFLSRYAVSADRRDVVAALYWMESSRRHGVEPVGGLLQHVWANLPDADREEVISEVFRLLSEGPPEGAQERLEGGQGR